MPELAKKLIFICSPLTGQHITLHKWEKKRKKINKDRKQKRERDGSFSLLSDVTEGRRVSLLPSLFFYVLFFWKGENSLPSITYIKKHLPEKLL